MKKIIKNGIIVTPTESFEGDVLIVNGIIVEVGLDLKTDSDIEVIDATGCYVMPGGVDVHTHLNLALGERKVSDGFYEGMRAAAFGGTTTIIDHPESGPKGCSLFHQPQYYKDMLEKEAVIDYGIHGVYQRVDDKVLNEIPQLIASGISSMKVYLTYDAMLNSDEVMQVLKSMKKYNGLTAFHAEEDDMINSLKSQFGEEGKLSPIYHPKSRPDIAESKAISRILNIADSCDNAPVYIVHLSTKKGLKVIEDAQAKGQNVIAETCPQYLLLDESCYDKPDNEGLKYIMAPPLRTVTDQDALWKGLEKGSITVIATDHCSFSFEDKLKYGKDDFRQCPGGSAGVETRLPLMFSEGVLKGKFSINRFVELVSANPAKIMGIYPKKGNLMPGSDADIIIWDANLEKVISVESLHQKCDYTPFENMKVKGWPVMTMVRGNVVVDKDKFVGKKGFGEFLHRNPFKNIKI